MSAVPAAKAALLAVVAAATGAVQTSYGPPGSQYAEHESVWLGDVPRFGDAASIGQVSHRETFEIPVVVSVLHEDDNHQAAEERVWAIAAPIEDAIRAAPGLNGAAGVQAAYVSGKASESYADTGGRVVEVSIIVSVRSKF